MEKARKNLITASILSEIEKNKEVRKLLKIPEDYSPGEWVVITAYYSMYMASVAVLASVGLKSKNHDATILALEELFVKKGLLEKDILKMIKGILREDYPKNLSHCYECNFSINNRCIVNNYNMKYK